MLNLLQVDALQLPFQRQLKASELLRRHQKLALRQSPFQRTGREPTVLDAPYVHRIALLASERLAMKKRHGRGGQSNDREQQCEKGWANHFDGSPRWVNWAKSVPRGSPCHARR